MNTSSGIGNFFKGALLTGALALGGEAKLAPAQENAPAAKQATSQVEEAKPVEKTSGAKELAKAPENKNAPKILNPESEDDKKMIDAIKMMYTDKDFNLDKNKGTLMYFSSETCGPCRVLEPKIDQIKSQGLLSEFNLVKAKTNSSYSEVTINNKKFPVADGNFHGPLSPLSKFSGNNAVPTLLAVYITPAGKFVAQRLDYYSNTQGSPAEIVEGFKNAFKKEASNVDGIKLENDLPVTYKAKTAE